MFEFNDVVSVLLILAFVVDFLCLEHLTFTRNIAQFVFDSLGFQLSSFVLLVSILWSGTFWAREASMTSATQFDSQLVKMVRLLHVAHSFDLSLYKQYHAMDSH